MLIASRQVPVILVGNKIDLRGGEVTNEGLEAEIAPIMREFKVSATQTQTMTLRTFTVPMSSAC